MLYAYQREALDISLALRDHLVSGAPWPSEQIQAADAKCREEASRLAQERAVRTKGRDRSEHLEEEVQACLVAVLAGEGLVWQEQGQGWIIEVSHSPLGYLPSGKHSVPRALASRAGAVAGWPDLDIRAVSVGPGPRPLAWLLELKTSTGSLSQAQRARIGRLVETGHPVRVVKGGVQEALLDVCRVLRDGDVWTGMSGVSLGPAGQSKRSRKS